jgi:NADH-quinone oxidoreductase E subunit
MSTPLTFSAEELQKLESIKKRYPEAKAALMPALWMAQAKWGWLSEDAMKCVAEALALPLAHVRGVATFYTMYFKKPMGKYHLQICTNVSCMLRGGDTIFEQAKKKYGIGHNECSADGRLSLEEVECMGACGGAPMIAINEDYHEHINFEQVEKLIAALP